MHTSPALCFKTEGQYTLARIPIGGCCATRSLLQEVARQAEVSLDRSAHCTVLQQVCFGADVLYPVEINPANEIVRGVSIFR